MSEQSNRTKAYLALGAICIIWGTTYTAIKIAVQHFPPYLMVGLRQTTAGLLLLAWAFFSGRAARMEPKYLLLQFITGVVTITGGNGFITWGMQYVSSGLSSVIGSLTPVMVVLINLAWRGSERLNLLIISGVMIGFVGMGLIFHDGWRDFANPDYRLGIAGCFASCLTWSLGTVMSKRWMRAGVSPVFNAGLQITSGGLGGFALSLMLDRSHSIDHTWAGWSALVYLILIGSALAFSLYMFVLKQLSATVSSLYTYINPIVAIALGSLFLGEKVTLMEAAGMAVTIAGVYLVNLGYSRN